MLNAKSMSLIMEFKNRLVSKVKFEQATRKLEQVKDRNRC